MNAKAKAVIRAAKAVGVQQVKASVYDLPTDAAAIVSEINKLAAKGKGQSGGVPSVYNQAEIAKQV